MAFAGDVLGWRGTFFVMLSSSVFPAWMGFGSSQCRAGREVKQPLCAMPGS